MNNTTQKFAIQSTTDAKSIKKLRHKLKLTQAMFAQLCNVSIKTVERWESSDENIKGSIATLVAILLNEPQIVDYFSMKPKTLPLRLYYMRQDEICTIIDVDDRTQNVSIQNYKKDPILTAFGKNNYPSYEDYEEFLRSRCFPENRDKMKLILRELDLPFYDPFMIIEKTKGKMAEDDFWIKIER